MDTLNGGASLDALFQLADRVIGLCKLYIRAAKDAPSDLRVILIEITALKVLLDNLKFLAEWDSKHGSQSILDSLLQDEGPIIGCAKSISELEKLFPPPVQSPPNSQQKVKELLATLSWPFKQEKAKRILQEISLFKSTISLALTVDHHHDIKQIRHETREMHAILDENQRDKVCTWLRHTDPSPTHNRAYSQYEFGTGNWMLRTSEWENFINVKYRCLWIHGIPGAGKTILASHLIEVIRCIKVPHDQKHGLVYYYCYFGHNQEEAAPLLRWFLDQLCRQAGCVPTTLFELYQTGREPSLTELLACLEAVLKNYDRVFLVVDAVDESKPRGDTLRVLRDLATDVRFNKIQLLVTSRVYIDIEEVLQGLSISISMSNPEVTTDIKRFVQSAMQSNPKFRRWTPELLEETQEALAVGAQGMFRWAACQLYELQRLKCEPSIIRKALKTLPKTLDETYERIFLAIPAESKIFVRYAFFWMHFNSIILDANSDLEVFVKFGDISCTCLLQAIESSLASLGADLRGGIFDREALREHCGCLIDMRHEEKKIFPAARTEEKFMVETVAFAHYTVLEYLTSSRVSSGPAAEFSISTNSYIMQLFEHILLAAPRARYDRNTCETEHEKLWDNFALYSIAVIEAVLYDRPQWFPQRINCPSDKAWKLVADSVIHLVSSEDIFSAVCRGVVNHIRATDRLPNTYFSNPVWRSALEDQWLESTSFRLLILVLMCCEEYGDIVSYYIERCDLASIFRTQHTLSLSLNSYFRKGGDKIHQYEFNCSFIEIFAQITFYSFTYLDFLLTIESGMYDPSKVLVAHVGSHYDCDYCAGDKDNTCIVRRLLQEGADPNGGGYWVTPLQIAVFSDQPAVVAQLLIAGADPNSTGGDGVKWEGNTILEYFTHLQGRSPLDLIQSGIQAEWDLRNDWRHQLDKRGETNEQMSQLLLAYGARAFSVNKSLAHSTQSPSRSEQSSLSRREETVDGNDIGIQSTSDIIMHGNDIKDGLYSA